MPGPAFRFAPEYAQHAQIFFSLYFTMTALHALHMIVGLGVMAMVDRCGTAGSHVAGHVQLAALFVRYVLEPALAVDVSCPDVGGIDREPNPLEAEFVGQIDAASDQFGADAEVLESGADDDQHFALLMVDGKNRGMAD